MHIEQLKRIHAASNQLRVGFARGAPASLNESQRANLKALGYLGGDE